MTLAFIVAGCSDHRGSSGSANPHPNAAVSTASASDAQPASVLVGRVTKGPLRPVQPEGQLSAAPVAGARIDVATADGNPVTRAETDATGAFRISLAPGTYQVTMSSFYGAMFTKDLPATITIGAGEEKRLDIVLDTGIR